MANTKPKKILAVMLSLVLAFSVMSVSALTAFADYVATLTPANGLVYDTVYGVFGGEYALMTKTVVFKGVYDWAPGMDPVDMRGSVTDIVDADGNVVLHSFSSSGTVQDADKHPEAKADWTIGSLRGLGHDMEAGTIVVRSTSTQLYGVVTPEGKQVIPAQYKNIGAINEDIYGFNASGNKATIDLFDGTGKSLGSFTFTSAYSSQPNMSGGPRDWMTVVKRDPYVVVSDSMTDIGIIYKQDGKYVKATAKKVYSADADGNALLRESDDYAYLQLANGNKVRLAKVTDDSYASFDGPFVTVRGADGTSATKCFTREGKLVGDGKLPFCSIVDNYALLGNWDGRSDEGSTCALFDASGKKVNEFKSDYAKLFFKGTRTYNNNGPNQKLVTADGTYYCFSVEDPYDSDDGYFYNLRVYGIDGKLVKDLGKGFEYPEYMSEVTAGTRSDGTSKSTVLGYEVTIEWGSDRYYYDTNLNKVASREALGDDSWSEEGAGDDNTPRLMLSNTYKLADGTSVEAQVYVPRNYEGPTPYSSKVVKADGTPAKLGGYSLGTCVVAGDGYSVWNSVKHGNADMWWATDGKGKWGAVDSKGAVVVPFEYDGYYDSGMPNTDYSLVKKSDKWYFLRMTNENQEDPKPEDPTTEGFERLAGDNALNTMKAIVSSGGFPKGGTVVLANAWGFHDALTAAGIAGLCNAPVVMTDGATLSDQAREMIVQLAPKKLIVCGGEATVSKAVAEAAQKAAGGATLERCAGDNAAGTAVMIFALGIKLGGNDMAAAADEGASWSNTAIIATSGTYHDALAAAPLSYAAHLPIFMTEWTGALSDATIKAMKDGKITRAYIAGGDYWIPASTAKQLDAAGIKVVKRLAGNTAVETSAAIAEEALAAYGMSANKLGVATTTSHYDALAGAAFCGKNNSVLLLANDENLSSINGFAMSHASEISSVFALGGTSSVTPAMTAALAKVLG